LNKIQFGRMIRYGKNTRSEDVIKNNSVVIVMFNQVYKILITKFFPERG